MRVKLSADWQIRLVAYLLYVYSRMVFATVRVTYATPVPQALKKGPVLLAVWHQQLFAVPALAKPNPHPLVGLMSASRDGQLTRTIARHFGIGAAVGSSSKQSISGARQLIALAKQGNSLFLTPDGPRGPAYVAKQGATELSRLMGLPLIPCAARYAGKATFASWDTFWLPLPFARMTLAWGQSLPPKSTPENLTAALQSLNAALDKSAPTR